MAHGRICRAVTGCIFRIGTNPLASAHVRPTSPCLAIYPPPPWGLPERKSEPRGRFVSPMLFPLGAALASACRPPRTALPSPISGVDQMAGQRVRLPLPLDGLLRRRPARRPRPPGFYICPPPPLAPRALPPPRVGARPMSRMLEQIVAQKW